VAELLDHAFHIPARVDVLDSGAEVSFRRLRAALDNRAEGIAFSATGEETDRLARTPLFAFLSDRWRCGKHDQQNHARKDQFSCHGFLLSFTRGWHVLRAAFSIHSPFHLNVPIKPFAN